jgi:hypothetical protein
MPPADSQDMTDLDTIQQEIAEDQRGYEATLAALADKGGAYVVLLASCGNIDFGQDSSRALPGVPKKHLRVGSLKAAAQACRLYIEHHELGGGNWRGGEVIERKTKKTIAQISYNGRAWQPGAWPQPEIAL